MRCFGRLATLAASTLILPPSFACASDAGSQQFAWQHGPVNAAASATVAPDGSQVGGTSKLELDTAGLQAAVTGTIATNTSRDASPGAPPEIQATTDSGSWTRAQLGLKAQADGPLNSKLAVTGQDRISQSVSPYGPGNGVRQTLETQALSGTVTATVPVTANLGAEVSGAAEQSVTRNATLGSDGAASRLTTGDTQLSGKLSYKLTDRVSLEGGASVERQDASLDGNAADAASFAYVKPKAGVTVTPWQGATAKVGVEHAVDPLNAANYLALANLADRPQNLKIAPDHAWQYQASLSQNIGAANVAASLTQSRSGTVTELAPAAGGQTPASVPLKSRRKATLKLSLPLEALGLSGTQLQSSATWRHSRVRDPVTGKYRRASAEAPREAGIDLTKTLPGGNTKIGLSGDLATTRDFYQVKELTEQHTAPRLGAFLSYDPGPLAFDLRVDGLAGGSQTYTDTLYNSTRTGAVAGVNTRREGGTHISVQFSRKM